MQGVWFVASPLRVQPARKSTMTDRNELRTPHQRLHQAITEIKWSRDCSMLAPPRCANVTACVPWLSTCICLVQLLSSTPDRQRTEGPTHRHCSMLEPQGAQIEVHAKAPTLAQHMDEQRLVKHPAEHVRVALKFGSRKCASILSGRLTQHLAALSRQIRGLM